MSTEVRAPSATPAASGNGRSRAAAPSEQTPTNHRIVRGDARELSFLPDESVHLVVTSPPYFELKSQVGSFGNNFNNRVEEALASATDFWTAYREGQFGTSPRPWLGYIFLLADTAASRRAGTRIATPHFPARSEFQGASYARRLELFCRRLVLERLYGSACLILADPDCADADVNYNEPAEDLAAAQFITDLIRHAIP